MGWTLQTPPCFVASTIRIVVDENDHVVADVRALDNQEEALANAHLIAAAPDLLAALQVAEAAMVQHCDALHYPEEDRAACHMARAAIAKAEGR